MCRDSKCAVKTPNQVIVAIDWSASTTICSPVEGWSLLTGTIVSCKESSMAGRLSRMSILGGLYRSDSTPTGIRSDEERNDGGTVDTAKDGELMSHEGEKLRL